MLGLERTDDVLDLGCGTGHLAQEMRVLTDGRVVGIDLSPEMIALAREAAPDTIEFFTGAAEALDMPGQFDAIFCNSAFQWFTDGPRALANCFAALRDGRAHGHAGAGAPGLLPAVRARRRRRSPRDPRTSETWSHFRTPWTFFETGDEYGRLFAAAGFSVVAAEMEELREHTTPERALDMFESGAAAGYLNPDCYDVPLPPEYADAARELILADFRAAGDRRRADRASLLPRLRARAEALTARRRPPTEGDLRVPERQ